MDPDEILGIIDYKDKYRNWLISRKEWSILNNNFDVEWEK